MSTPTFDVITKIKADLVWSHPFFAALILSMPIVEDTTGEVETFATDGDSIFYNAAYLASLKPGEVKFILAHEILHVAFDHVFRLSERDADLWNQATDYVINGILVDEGLGTMPKGGLLDKKLVESTVGNAEAVYGVLEKRKKANQPQPKPGNQPGGAGKPGNQPTPKGAAGKPQPGKTGAGKPQPGNGNPGGALDKLLKPKGDAAELAKKQAENKVRVAQARDAASLAEGKLSEGLKRLVDELLTTETDWRAILRRFFSERTKETFSFARPKRRFLSEDLYLPSLSGEKLGPIVIAVDCSGSIDDKTLAKFSAEVSGIVEDTKPRQVKVIYFDSEVIGKPDVFYPVDGDVVKLDHKGGGGTAFSPVFQAINADLETPPVAVVFLTDLLCSDYGPPPDYPVLWASILKNKTAPFGEVCFIGAVKR